MIHDLLCPPFMQADAGGEWLGRVGSPEVVQKDPPGLADVGGTHDGNQASCACVEVPDMINRQNACHTLGVPRAVECRDCVK